MSDCPEDRGRMTVERMLRTLVEIDRQIICPRPTLFGEMAHLTRALALAAIETLRRNDRGFSLHTPADQQLEMADMGDLSDVIDNAFFGIPDDARETWRIGKP